MRTSIHSAVAIGILLIVIPPNTVSGSITYAPQNAVNLVGHSVTFQCQTSITNRAVYWQFTNVNGVLQPPIYTGIMNPTYASRGFSVSYSSSSQASEYNLTIANVSLTDAGTYTCQDNNGIGEARAAWLTVLDADPQCWKSGVADNATNVTCTVSVYGRISDSNRLVPVFSWTNCSTLFSSRVSYTALNGDSFYRQYTVAVLVELQGPLNECALELSFTAVVSDSTIDYRRPAQVYYANTFTLQAADTSIVAPQLSETQTVSATTSKTPQTTATSSIPAHSSITPAAITSQTLQAAVILTVNPQPSETQTATISKTTHPTSTSSIASHSSITPTATTYQPLQTTAIFTAAPRSPVILVATNSQTPIKKKRHRLRRKLRKLRKVRQRGVHR